VRWRCGAGEKWARVLVWVRRKLDSWEGAGCGIRGRGNFGGGGRWQCQGERGVMSGDNAGGISVISASGKSSEIATKISEIDQVFFGVLLEGKTVGPLTRWKAALRPTPGFMPFLFFGIKKCFQLCRCLRGQSARSSAYRRDV
jgi:hypothetical protein